MLHQYYKWRYRRTQTAGAFKLPRNQYGAQSFRGNFGSYLSQDSVRGRNFDRFDLPHKRRRWLHLLLVIALLLVLGWLIYESTAALIVFGD